MGFALLLAWIVGLYALVMVLSRPKDEDEEQPAPSIQPRVRRSSSYSGMTRTSSRSTYPRMRNSS